MTVFPGTATNLAAVVALNAIVTTLGAQADDRFRVIGYQRQTKSAERIRPKVLVQCWIENASKDQGKNSLSGPKIHDVTVGIQYSVSRPATADIATLMNEASTDAQRATALENMNGADYNASIAMYLAWTAVDYILEDNRNKYFGLPDYSIQQPWHSDFRQDSPVEQGGMTFNTANSKFTFLVYESKLGDSLTAIGTMYTEFIGAGIDEELDEVSKIATETTY
jgi:hypothetical protein